MEGRTLFLEALRHRLFGDNARATTYFLAAGKAGCGEAYWHLYQRDIYGVGFAFTIQTQWPTGFNI